MAETMTRSPAAPAAEETFELSPEDLAAPQGTDEVDLEVEEDETPEAGETKPQPADDKKPEVKAETKPEPEPDKPKPVAKAEDKTHEPEREEPRERLHPAAREERAKRKEYARLYAETKDQLDEAERTIRLLRAEADQTNDPALKKWNEELLQEASKATDLADVVKITIREMDRRDRARVRQLNQHLYTLQCDISEAKARTRHADFEAVITKAGLFDAIATDANGRFKDERIGRRIYYNADGSLNADPAERMYRLAVGKLEVEREQRGEPEPEEREEKPVKNQNGAGREEKKAPREEVIEAERRGAAKVVEQVSNNSTRLRGIRSIPKASSGPIQITKKQLDVMLESEPEQYARLIARRPDLERFHLG